MNALLSWRITGRLDLNFMFKKISAYIFFYFLLRSTFAQIIISTPIENAVYQRNSLNKANIIIQGNYQQPNITSIEARLINPVSSLPVVGFDWTLIQSMPNLGYFSGQLSNVPGGWYKLEIRALKTGSVIETGAINRVGVGDVFLIAGQSNAQGHTDMQYLGASSEMVVTHNNGKYCSTEEIPFPAFTQLTGTVKPGVNGRDAWCYGNLGDKLVTKNGVPVAFFNAAASGSSVSNWRVSSENQSVTHPLTSQPFCSTPDENTNNPGYPSNYTTLNPYFFFRKSLNYYNSMFGLRSVLWHQGETDTYINTQSNTYDSLLTGVIQKSRTHYNANLPWVVSRVSLFYDLLSQQVIDGQNAVIDTTDQIFAGPETDAIKDVTPGDYIYRDGINVHFWAPQGLTALADAWSAYLDTAYFNHSIPVNPNTPPLATGTISGNSLIMSVPSGYASYKWIRTDLVGNSNYSNSAEGTSNTLTQLTGTYRCWVYEANGNMQVSNPINVNQALSISANGSVCSSNLYLSEINAAKISNGVGPIEFDKTNGSAIDGDGSPIILKGTSYSKGIGVSANSEIEYNLPANQYYKFQAKIGISDDISATCNNTGGMIFKVFGNGNLIYTSPTIYRNTALQEININVFNYSNLKLKVEEAGNSPECNKGVWADAKLLCFLGDTTLPSNISNLVATDTLSKCISFSWTHATDDFVVNGYYLYLNGIPVDTIPGTQNTYTVSGLLPGDFVNFGVKAFDAANNLSPTMISKILNTIQPAISYVGDGYICTSRSYLPTTKIPDGGTFEIELGPAHTINTLTGEFYSVNTGEFYGNYYFGTEIPGCEAEISFVIGTIPPPASTPIISADKSIINQGTAVNFSSSACTGSTLVWSFSSSNNTSASFNPVATDTFYAACQQSFCFNYSNNIIVKVLPNCGSSVTLTNPADNLGSRINSLVYNSSNNIIATNQITPSNTIQYNAANTILLSPGFKIDPGVIFSAKIQNCP